MIQSSLMDRLQNALFFAHVRGTLLGLVLSIAIFHTVQGQVFRAVLSWGTVLVYGCTIIFYHNGLRRIADTLISREPNS